MRDPDAEFREIYEAFHPAIRRYLGRFVAESEADELAQEVFVRVHAALPDFRGEAKISTWLYRIATNAALDRVRSAGHRQAASESSGAAAEPASDACASIADQNAWTGERAVSTEAQVVRKAMNECIRRFVLELPDPYRTVLVLADLEGLRDREVADVLEVSLETVKMRLHRGRQRLKEALLKHCDPAWIEGNDFVPVITRGSGKAG